MQGVSPYIPDIDKPYFIISSSLDSGGIAQVKVWSYLVESDMASWTTDKTAEQLSYSLQKTTALSQMNLISENIITVGDGETKTLFHNLGFRPFCRFWISQNRGWGFKVWDKNTLGTKLPTAGTTENNQIVVDESKITIYAEDPFGSGKSQDFLIRIYNYAIPI